MSEIDEIAARYARRTDAGRYSPFRSEVLLSLQERQRKMRDLWVGTGLTALAPLRIAEVGCGAGGNLLEFLRMGATPEYLTGIELLPDRYEQARRVLPSASHVLLGDAIQASIEAASQDMVLQSTVFSSLLDPETREALAAAMWRWLRPGGGVLWYDFMVNNPRNPDVRGVPLAEVRRLFPHGRMSSRRVTLAPPLARPLCSLHPVLHTVFNSVPLLRTHLLAWIIKP